MKSATAATFSTEEFDALLLGLSWAMDDEEPSVAIAASSACQKISDLLPEPDTDPLDCPAPNPDDPTGSHWVPFLESACDAECKLSLVYQDKTGAGSSRIIWPLMVDTWRRPEAIVAWCESRRDFRVFRVDRIQSLELLDRYPTRRQVLLAKWQLQEEDES